MVVNQEQAEIVKLIFDLFLQGNGTQKIKQELEKRGILTATGKKVWSPSQIGRMLKNSFYCNNSWSDELFVCRLLFQPVG